MEGSSSPQDQFPKASCSLVYGAPCDLQMETEATVQSSAEGNDRWGTLEGVKHPSATFCWGSEVSLSKIVVRLPWGLLWGLCLSLVR